MRVRVLAVAMLVVASAMLTLGLGGCRKTATSAANGPEHYPMRGVVVSTDAANGEVTLRHGEIPGFMEAMTMPYKLAEPSELSELHPGDTITATLLTDRDAAGPFHMRLTELVVIAQGQPDHKPTRQYHLPAAGDEVPDFKLLNQSDKTIDLKQYRGRVVVMTFIYTRCPLSDYCPRMSHNFAEIDKALAADPKLYKATHLLSVSFDPANDTPKVLKSYGAAYTGRFVNETFAHWEFAAPPVAKLAEMEQWFDVGVTPGESGTLQHSLSTVVIGKDGKVVAFYPTNDWTIATVMEKVKAAAE